MALTQEQLDTLELTAQILNWFSLALTAFVIITYALFKWRFPSSLALYFSICSFCNAFFLQLGVGIVGLRTTQDTDWLCWIQGIGIQFFGVAITWWWMCIGINLYMTIVVRTDEPQKYNKYYHLVGWGVPFVSTCVPLTVLKYGRSNPVWCWLENDQYHLWQFGSLFGHMALCSVVGMAMWCRVIYTARRLHQEAVVRNERHFFKPFIIRHILFVILFMSVFIIVVINRLYQAILSEVEYHLLLVSIIILTGQGCITFLAFGTSRKIFRAWRQLFVRTRQRISAWYKRFRGTYIREEEEEEILFEGDASLPTHDTRYV